VVYLYLHIGGEIEISVKRIISIVDVQILDQSLYDGETIKNYTIEKISNDSQKSAVIAYSEGSRQHFTLYLSPISTASLKKRLGNKLTCLKGSFVS
jgi:hypothetical protein